MKKVPPQSCPKCKSQDIQCIDAGMHDDSEYRETVECHACGRAWDNIFSFTLFQLIDPMDH